MKANAVLFAAGLTLLAAGAPFPAFGQFDLPAGANRPAPAGELCPKARLQAAARQTKRGASWAGPEAKPTGGTRGRTWAPD